MLKIIEILKNFVPLWQNGEDMKKTIGTTIGILAVLILFVMPLYSCNKSSENTNSSSDSGLKAKGVIEAPDFSVLDSSGESVNLSDFVGKPVVLNFWASWCPPCKNEMPHFNEAFNEYKDDVVFLMVNLTDGSRETKSTAEKYLKSNGYEFTVFFDTEQSAAYAFSVSSIPATYFINREGQVVKFENRYGLEVAGFQGAVDKKSLIDGIGLIK